MKSKICALCNKEATTLYRVQISKGLVAEDAQLITKDAITLIEYSNRLDHINNSMKNQI
jgi:hypothetical protein